MSTGIYKYTKLEYMTLAIENGIFASHLDNVNDPCQTNFGIKLDEQFDYLDEITRLDNSSITA